METNVDNNKRFILSALKEVEKKLKNDPEFDGITFEFQEGVTGTSGSIEVAEKNKERIGNCDIYIADLSIVNYYPTVLKKILILFRQYYRPHINNNVMLEYGYAESRIGNESIIGVINTAYGSPKRDEQILPFDIRSLRFPIEYELRPSIKNGKAEAKKKLAYDLLGAIRTVVIEVLRKRRCKYAPAITWEDWNQEFGNKPQFINHEKSNQIKKLINEAANGKISKLILRIKGISGLGKTRILLDAFEPKQEDEKLLILSSEVLYLNYSEKYDCEKLFRDLESNKETKYIILDNCPENVLRKLMPIINKPDNHNHLITITSDIDEESKIKEVNYIILEKKDTSVVTEQLLEYNFKQLKDEHRRKITDFSDGIPLMAVLLAEGCKENSEFVGNLDDKEILNKLLGEKAKDDKTRRILRSISLFSYIGIEDEYKSQLEFVSRNASLTGIETNIDTIFDKFMETIEIFRKRQIIENKGRFIGIRPYPLAIYLAQEWFDICNPDRLQRVILDIISLSEPNKSILSKSFLEQLKYLNVSEKAQKMLGKLVGVHGPFDSAEILNTELGSRFFRSFAEVNPVAVSENLYRNLSEKPINELRKIDDGRRNLVWTLETLCFDKRTYENSIKILFSLALAENEYYGNNATGVLRGLFHIRLANTEVNLENRWNTIKWALSFNEEEYTKLALECMTNALYTNLFIRYHGPEKQGTRELHFYEPSKEEIDKYFINIIQELKKMIVEKKCCTVEAEKIIAGNIVNLCRFELADKILPVINEIIFYKDRQWEVARSELNKDINIHRKEMASYFPQVFNDLQKILESITPKDFGFKYEYYIKDGWRKDSVIIEDDVLELKFKEIAKDFRENIDILSDSFIIFYTPTQSNEYKFAKYLYEELSDDDNLIQKFMSLSFDAISEILPENRRLVLFTCFASCLSEEYKEKILNEFKKNQKLQPSLIELLGNVKFSQGNFNLLFEFVEQQIILMDDFLKLSRSDILFFSSIGSLNFAYKQIFNWGYIGYKIIIEYMYILSVYDNKKVQPLIYYLRNSLNKLGLSSISRNSTDNHVMIYSVCNVLKNDNDVDFPRFVLSELLGNINSNNYYTTSSDYVSDIFKLLIDKYFCEIWDLLSEALLSTDKDFFKYFSLKNILGSRIGGFDDDIGLLFIHKSYTDILIEWCRNNIDLAPTRLAEMVPIFSNGTGISRWFPITRQLIDEFGDSDKVLEALECNMGNFSWTGSLVPLFQQKIGLFIELLEHKNLKVKEWAETNIKWLKDALSKREAQEKEMDFLL
jgi:hypothetical protein